MKDRVQIVSWNTRKTVGPDWRRHPKMIPSKIECFVAASP